MNIVPTRATRKIAQQMFADVKRGEAGADAALAWFDDVYPDQYAALVGLLLDGPPRTKLKIATDREARDPDALLAAVITSTCETFDITTDNLLLNRSRMHFAARAVAMSACRMLGLSTPTIGVRFDRDHTTVIHATRRVDADPELLAVAQQIAKPWTQNAEAA